MRTDYYLFGLFAGFCAIGALKFPASVSAQDSSPTGTVPGATSALRKVEGEWRDVTVDLLSVKRTDGDTLTINFKYTNNGSKKIEVHQVASFGYENLAQYVYYIDATNRKKATVLKDAEGNFIASQMKGMVLEPGASRTGWAQLPAPPANVSKVTVFLPDAPPFESVEIKP